MPFSSLLLATVILTVGCTGKNESASLRITMPGTFSATAAKTTAQHKVSTFNVDGSDDAWNTTLNPAKGAELNCFAVFIGGPGLSGKSCEVNTAGVISTFEFGERLYAGLVPAGESISIGEIPPGSRMIHVVGFKAATATDCSNNKLPSDIDKKVLSEPFLIAQQALNVVSGNNEVSIQPVLNIAKKITTCSFDNSDSMKNNLPMFGDRRDGSLILGPTAFTTLNFGTDRYNSYATMTLAPTAGGPTSTKIFGAQKQIIDINTATGDVVTVSGTITSDEFQIGDEVMWYVSSGNAGGGAPDDEDKGACGSKLFLGSYGSRKIVSIESVGSATALKMSAPLVDTPQKIKNSNLTASVASGTFCRISLTRVPNFDLLKVAPSATWKLQAPPYNMTNGLGGLVVFRAKKIEAVGTLFVSADSAGYSGGLSAYVAGTSVAGAGTNSQSLGNISGGGAMMSTAGAGGAGGGAGGASSATGAPFGGQPLNFCYAPVFSRISAGVTSTCATSATGAIRCWGQGSAGAIGEGLLPFFRTTPSFVATTENFMTTSTGSGFNCGITGSQKLFCWGSNAYGQLGDGSTALRSVPTAIEPDGNYATVSAGFASTCGITTAGSLKCWGKNINGELGDGTMTNRSSPVLIDAGTAYKSVSVGKISTCAITVAGTLKCWGDNTYGQLGNGTLTSSTLPVVIGAGLYESVSVGPNHACALTSSTPSILKCWGANTYGQLGDGTTTSQLTPALTAGSFKMVRAGSQFTCGITDTDLIKCWGLNTNGQVGDGTTTTRLSPGRVTSSASYKSLSLGEAHACAITNLGEIHCWGLNTTGQLGNGTLTASMSPTALKLQNVCRPITDQKMFFGGGGGAGLVGGGQGGGLMLIYAKETTGTGALTLTANGAPGSTSTLSSGGGGAGTIGFSVKSPGIASTNVLANGGSAATSSSHAGGGGGGTIEIKYCATSGAPAFVSTSILASGGAGLATSNPGAMGFLRTETSDLCSID